MHHRKPSLLSLAVLVASLGYFVDIYDLLLFSIIRIKSLSSLGLSADQVREVGLQLLDVQMAGLLLGGILWGVLADKKGRLKVLFGSIILYSAANILNGLVHSTEAYMVWRFLAGVGLAGELGAGVTLVSEILPKEKRGYGTMIISAVGIAGAVVAGMVAHWFSWRTSFFVGGGLGILLLLLRLGVLESGMFERSLQTETPRGDFLSLFTNRQRLGKYLLCIAIGLPCWYVIGILISFSNDFAKALQVRGSISPATAVMVSYAALSIGSLAAGTLSQIWKSRRKALTLFLLLTLLGIVLYFFTWRLSVSAFYGICGLLGFGVGYWAIFVTVAAEQFGTNLRGTVATTVPNFVRGMLVPITLLFQFLEPRLNMLRSGFLTGLLCMAVALTAALFLQETYHKDLDYLEI